MKRLAVVLAFLTLSTAAHAGYVIVSGGAGGGSGGSGGYAMEPATVTINAAQGLTGTTGVFSSTVTATAFTLSGSGNPSFINPPDGKTYQIMGTTGTPVQGHYLVAGASNTVVDGGAVPSNNGILSTGVTISSGITISIPSVIATTSTITSSMSVVLAATPEGTAWITLTLPSAASYPGLEIMIYNTGSSTGTIKVKGAGTDLIQGTGTIRLDAKYQRASLYSLGSVGWGAGLGGIQQTPFAIQSIPDEAGGVTIATSSSVIQCPIYVTVPVAVTGFRLDKAGGSAGFISAGIFDMDGNYVIGVSSQATVSGVNTYALATAFQLPPGWYKAAFSANNSATTFTGSNSLNDVTAMCSIGATPTNMDFSKITLTTGGNRNQAPVHFDIIVNGGQQAN